MPPQTSALEIRGNPSGLLDDPLLLSVRGAGSETATWRARLHDDDGRVWRASAGRAEDLAAGWAPAKATSGAVPALQSLRPVGIEVRVETPDGRAASRTLTRLLVAGGVRVRRWRGALAATLWLPADARPCATVVLDATSGPLPAAVATLAAPLLASRGVLALIVLPPRDDGAPTDALAAALERLAAVPAATPEATVLSVLDPLSPSLDPDADTSIVVPPGIGVHGEDASAAVLRDVAWDLLLARLGARPRTARPPA